MRILSVIAILIAYGSVYPGNFSVPEAGAVRKFLTDWRLFTSRGDMLGNLALFFPLGVASILFASLGLSAKIRIVWLLFLAFAFSFVLQLAQVWLPSRSAALADVIWNMAGMASGMTAAHLIRRRIPERAHLFDYASLAALSVLILWLLTELLPLVPTLDWQKFKDALKPLFLDYTLSFPVAMMHAVGVIIAGSAFVVLGPRPVSWLSGAVLLVIAGKLVIVNLTLNASILAGLLAGYAGFLVMLRLCRTKIFEPAFWLLFAAWSITAIMPFSPAPGGTFNIIPFATMLQGSMETGARALLRSLFIYTSLLWLTQKMGASVKAATVGLAIWSSLLELTQMGLLGRTADITEPILLLLVGWVLPVAQRYAQEAPLPPSIIRNDSYAGEQPLAARTSSHQTWWTVQILTVLCLAASFWGGLRMVGIPYNLRELFLGDAHFWYLLVFAVALLWVGSGAVWMGAKIASSKMPFFSLPARALVVSLISLALLTLSVTQESIKDIAGANNLYWFVVNRNIWGSGWRDFFVLAGPDMIGIIERCGRYAALYSPLLIFLALIFSLSYLHERNLLTLPRVLVLMASALPWLWLAKSITFDWSSTDNLNELIARDGPMGWGGGGYLYALLGLLCANAVMLGRTLCSFNRLALVMILSIAALPLGWWLLNLGLDPRVEKYGFTFSGVQFLLGPDREHLLTDMELFARWCVLQVGFIAVTALGIRGALLNPYRAQHIPANEVNARQDEVSPAK